MICFEKETLLVFATLLFVYGIPAFEIKYTSIYPSNPVEIGSTVRLSCQTDGHYEYCIWKHKSRTCNFEWKYISGTVEQTMCNEIGNRTTFIGSYDDHECAMELNNIQFLDAGEWSCEMEKYVLGSLRGSSHKKTLRLDVIPKIYPSSTNLYTTNNAAEIIHQTTVESTDLMLDVESSSTYNS